MGQFLSLLCQFTSTLIKYFISAMRSIIIPFSIFLISLLCVKGSDVESVIDRINRIYGDSGIQDSAGSFLASLERLYLDYEQYIDVITNPEIEDYNGLSRWTVNQINRYNELREKLSAHVQDVRDKYVEERKLWEELYGDILKSLGFNRVDAIVAYYRKILTDGDNKRIRKKIRSIVAEMVIRMPSKGDEINYMMYKNWLLPSSKGVVTSLNIDDILSFNDWLLNGDFDEIDENQSIYRVKAILDKHLNDEMLNERDAIERKKMFEVANSRKEEAAKKRKLMYEERILEFRRFIDKSSGTSELLDLKNIVNNMATLVPSRRYILSERDKSESNDFPLKKFIDEKYPGYEISRIYQYYYDYMVLGRVESVFLELEGDLSTDNDRNRLFLKYVLAKVMKRSDSEKILDRLFEVSPDDEVVGQYLLSQGIDR
jgi:hypothetical protein